MPDNVRQVVVGTVVSGRIPTDGLVADLGRVCGTAEGVNPPNPSFAQWFSERWSGVVRGEHRAPGPGDGSGWRFGVAAEYARVRYPGHVGDLIRREILAHREHAFRFDGSGLIPRLVDELMDDRKRMSASDAEP